MESMRHPEAASSRPAAAAARRLSMPHTGSNRGNRFTFAPVSTCQRPILPSSYRIRPFHVASTPPMYPATAQSCQPCQLTPNKRGSPYRACIRLRRVRYRRAPCRLLLVPQYRALLAPPAEPSVAHRKGVAGRYRFIPYLREQRVCRQKATRTHCPPGARDTTKSSSRGVRKCGPRRPVPVGRILGTAILPAKPYPMVTGGGAACDMGW